MAKDLSKEPEKYDAMMEELQRITDDPNSVVAEKRKMLEKYSKEMSLSGTLQSIRDYTAETPEELTTLELCMVRTQRRALLYTLGGIAITGSYSCKFYSDLMRAQQTRVAKTITVCTGAFLGALQGVIQSNKGSMALMDELGPEYRLGQITEAERMHWQIDE
jgi:hypothetical protein